MNLKTTDVWIETDSLQATVVMQKDFFLNTYSNSRYVKKKTGYFLTKDELEKVIGEAFNAGIYYESGRDLRVQTKTDYINNILKKKTP